jgi:predicted CopG family antitoxin
MAKTIDVSDQTYAGLLRLANSFDDTPDDVIRRLLEERAHVRDYPLAARQEDANERGALSASAKRGERAAPGSILPEREYWRPILEVLVERGGSAPANDVIDEVGVRLRDRLMDRDHDQLDIGETRWRNRTRFARLRMREQGLLSGASHRGIWEITPQGRLYLQSPDETVREA